MQHFHRGIALVIALFALIMLSMFLYSLYRSGRNAEKDITLTVDTQTAAIAPPKEKPPSPALSSPPPAADTIFIHVAGAVKKPGVYKLSSNSRAVDAVHAAGGPIQSASLDGINLAQKLYDGTQLYIPYKNERIDVPSPSGSPSLTNRNDGNPTRSASHQGNSGKGKFTDPLRESVDLNQASITQLQQLPGVGPAMAQRIIDYRKSHDRFTDPLQLMDITGIGQKKYDKMKLFVTVNGKRGQ
jgi:competence protein ComEA